MYISCDIFQTLVDVNYQKYEFWKNILNNEYTQIFAEELWHEGLVYLRELMNECYASDFTKMQDLFYQEYELLFRVHGIQYDTEKAVSLLKQMHNTAPLFSDVIPFLQRLSPADTLIFCSDTDNDMIYNIVTKLAPKHVFTSENLKLYKLSRRGAFFGEILKQLGISNKEIIHIGDSESDILGAARMGIKSFLLNRQDKSIDSTSSLPDYTITNLLQVYEVI
jgi:putative hydrolase of the HAD superfamily